jgi:hypothetical protein
MSTGIERPNYTSLPPAIQAEIEAGWQRYRGRGHTRRQYDRAVVNVLVALAKLLCPWAFSHGQ